MTAPRDKERPLVLPRISQGTLVTDNVIHDTKRSEKRKRKKGRNEHLESSPHSPREPSLKKDSDQRISNLPSLRKPGHGTISPIKETKLSTFEKLPQLGTKLLHMSSGQKLPQIYDAHKNPDVHDRRKLPKINDRHNSTQTKVKEIRKKTSRRLEKGRFTAFEETGSDASSTMSRHQAKTVQDQSRMKRSRDLANRSRDYLLSLMPPKNAKCYTFSPGILSGAHQELLRMRTLMGRDKLSLERGRVDAVVSESRRRAANINSLMTGNKTNTTNNSIPGMHKPAHGSDVTGGVGGVTYGRKIANGGHTLSSVLKSSKIYKSDAVKAFLRAFRPSESSDRYFRDKCKDVTGRACADNRLFREKR